MRSPGRPMVLGSKPYGARAREVAVGFGKVWPSHEQSTVFRVGTVGSGCTSLQVAAASHAESPSEQVTRRTWSLKTR